MSSSDDRRSPSADEIAEVLLSLSDEHVREVEPEARRRAWARLSGQAGPVGLVGRPRRSTAEAGYRAVLRSSIRGWFLGFAAAAAVTGAALWLWFTPPAPLQYQLDGVPISQGPIRTGEKEALIEFTDASWIRVRRQTELDVSIVGERSALTRLWRGDLTVNVSQDAATDWRVLAGPYEVHVVGTRFDVQWEPKAHRLSLNMREGRSRVMGPEGVGRVLEEGESVSFVMPGAVAVEQITAAKVGAPAEPADAEAEQEVVAEQTEVRSMAVVSRVRTAGIKVDTPREEEAAPAPVSVSWPQLVAKGEFGEVVSRAKDAGVSSVLAGRGASDLKALAQAARYSGDVTLARRAWSKIRSRFAGQAIAVQAAFFLGRIEERRGNSREARRLFDAYLRESPRGVYASEALGRKLVLSQRSGRKASTARVAKAYLKRFPSGPYARVAKAALAD